MDVVDVLARTRIDIYVSEDNYFILRHLKEQWKRKNYSQTIDHLISSYWRLYKQMKTIRDENEDRKRTTAQ